MKPKHELTKRELDVCARSGSLFNTGGTQKNSRRRWRPRNVSITDFPGWIGVVIFDEDFPRRVVFSPGVLFLFILGGASGDFVWRFSILFFASALIARRRSGTTTTG